ncbi:MAG TPA: helix-turn-helix domain-containing protein [Micromonosporaceae bacterium]|nr:helix-turn-helix domain-containing protein [Micromonosporaceae bacterium]
MSGERTAVVLAAAYRCFTRHGIRRTTMDDIAAEAGMSRAAVYQYVRSKDDAFARLAQAMFDASLAQARHAAARPAGPAGVAGRLHAVLAAKLELVLGLWRDSPHHAGELLGESARVSAAQEAAYQAGLRDLLAGLVRAARAAGELPRGGPPATAVADVALAFTRGLEADPTAPDAARTLLRQGVRLLAAGLRGAAPAGSPAASAHPPAQPSAPSAPAQPSRRSP